MTQVYPSVNGGLIKYPDRVTTRTFFRASDRHTKNVTVKAGQVLKAHSFVESIQGGADAGKVIAHQGTAGDGVFNKIAGVTLYDVDASAADQVVPVYVEASFWADALVWAVDPEVDSILNSFGNTVAVTAYNTGVISPNAATTKRLQQQFVEQSGFEPLGFPSAGDVLGGTDYNV